MRFSLLPVMLGLGLATMGQNGIKVGLEVENTTPRWHLNVLAGYDRDLHERLAIGVDIIKGIDLSGGNTRVVVPVAGQSQNSYYVYSSFHPLTTRIWGMQYRSTFFLADRTYVGATLGFRRTTMTVEPDEYGTWDPSGALLPSPPRTVGHGMTYPLGVRIGFRSDLDGAYSDVYIGIGTRLGRGTHPLQRTVFHPHLEDQDRFGPIWLTAGYSIGIGW